MMKIQVPGQFFLIILFLGLTSPFYSTTARVSEMAELKSWERRLKHSIEELKRLQADYQKVHRELSEYEDRYVSLQSVCEGRLTSQSGVPVPTTNQTSVSTIRFTPYRGTTVAIFIGGVWTLRTFSEVSKALNSEALSANTNYDVFLYDSAGTLTLEFSVAWASDTTRTTDLAVQDGIYVKNGDASRRYIGTFRTTSSSTETEDSETNRLVWSECERVRRYLYTYDSANSWTYATDSWRVANNSGSANRVTYVVGLSESPVNARSLAVITNGTGALNYFATGIGVDSTGTNSALLRGAGSNSSIINQAWSEYVGFPGVGTHTIYWLERGHTSTITVYGDNNSPTELQSGMLVEIEG